MAEPLLNDRTRAQILAVIKNQPQSIMLSGPRGSGKMTIARWMTAAMLAVTLEKLDEQAYLKIISSPERTSIGIDAVRQLDHFLQLKVPSKTGTNRVVIIEDADLMTPEAQNSLLKTLEEPPVGTVLILTVADDRSMLATIRSRAQILYISAPAASVVELALIGYGSDEATSKRIMALSGGLPGLAFAMAENDQEHPLVTAAMAARTLIQSPVFKRLCIVDSLGKDKQAMHDTVRLLGQLGHDGLLTGKQTERWQKVLAAAQQAGEALHNGANPKLTLTRLMFAL